MPGIVCGKVEFSGHALRRMFERGISVDEVLVVVSTGEIIADYPDDSPLPSCLLLGIVKTRPIHVVAAKDSVNQLCVIITAYPPDPAQWQADFKTRRPT
jgi:hypothetical protein